MGHGASLSPSLTHSLSPSLSLLLSSLLLPTLELSDTNVYEPEIRARLGTAAHFCEVVVLKSFKPHIPNPKTLPLTPNPRVGGPRGVRVGGGRRGQRGGRERAGATRVYGPQIRARLGTTALENSLPSQPIPSFLNPEP